jgi:hypothetical protein
VLKVIIAAAATSMAFTEFRRQLFVVYFLDNRKLKYLLSGPGV